jgi:oligosaccharide repeat unit polymerase
MLRGGYSGIFLAIFSGITIGILASIASSIWPSIISLITLLIVTFSVSLFFMQRYVDILNIKQPTIPGFFYLIYLVMIFFPSFFIAIDKPAPYRDVYLLAVVSVLFTMPFGIWIANRAFRFHKNEIRAFFSKPIEKGKPSYHLRVVLGIFLLGALALVFLYLSEVRTVPLLAVLKNPGAYYELAQLREKSFKLLDTQLSYPYFWLRTFFFPFLIMLTLGYYLQTRRKGWLLFFLVSLGIGTLYAGFSLAKMPVAAIFLMVVLFIYVYRAGQIGIRFILFAIGLIFAFPLFVILTVQYGMGIGLLDAVSGIFRRLFYVPAHVLYYYFEIFPDQVGYLYGRSIGKLAWLMGWEHFNTANYVYRYLFPSGAESGLSNAAFIGNLNADFGLPGVLIGGLVVGFLMQAIQIFILRRRKTILNLVVYTFLIFAFWLLNQTALPIVLLSNGVILALILPWVIRALESFFKQTVEFREKKQRGSVDEGRMKLGESL